jgi:hypothetical protein
MNSDRFDSEPWLQIRLESGLLSLRIDRADLPLDELCGFASRRSKKRGFVFVSKVLGKHVPVRPHVMRKTQQLLSEKLQLDEPSLFIGMAETATALGQGVYESYLQSHPEEQHLYLQSTRYRLNQPLLLQFEETHSHATELWLHQPIDPLDQSMIDTVRSLVLVDDEISTGKTLLHLAEAFRNKHPKLEKVYFVSLIDWLGEENRSLLQTQLPIPIFFHSLLEGSYRFQENGSFDPGIAPSAVGNGDFKDSILPEQFGRLGVSRKLNLPLDYMIEELNLIENDRVLVLGTGEFSYPPFLLAEELEKRGYDVRFHTSTRSPLRPGGILGNALQFTDNYHDEIPNYLYNANPEAYDQIFVGYETNPIPSSHQLAELLNAKVIQFGAK